MVQHPPGDMPGQSHDGGVAGLRLGQLRDRVMAAIVETETLKTSSRCQFPPGGAPAELEALRVDMAVLTCREWEMVGLRSSERFSPLPKFKDGAVGIVVHGDRSQPGVGLAAPHSE